MRSLNIKDYTLKDWQKITSEWVSDAFKNFVDNFLYLFDGFNKLNEKHEIYRVVSDQTMDFLYTEAAISQNETYSVGTAKNQYSGSTTVFDLNSNFNNNNIDLRVSVDGVLKTPVTDYVETDANTITFNSDLTVGSSVLFVRGDYLSITGYQTPVTYSNVNVKQAFGTVTLSETNVESLIPLVSSEVSSSVATIANDDDGSQALSSARIYLYDPANPTQLDEDSDLRRVLDDTGYIWHTTLTDNVDQVDASILGITLSLPTDTTNNISYIEIYPYGGTGVTHMQLEGVDDNIDVVDLTSEDHLKKGYPVRIHIDKSDFAHQITITLQGRNIGNDSLGNSQYFYSLGYIKAYTVDYASSGTVTYDIGTPGNINNILISDPFIRPDELHDDAPIHIKVTTNDGLVILYDTSDSVFNPNAYPLITSGDNSILQLTAAKAAEYSATSFYITFTLNNINEKSPVFRKCDLTVAP